MKVNELRIGSLIQLYRKAEDKEMSIHTVCGIDNTPDIGWMIEIEDGFYINVDKGIDPIPLTEEWLLKFGFKKSKERNDFFRFKNIIAIIDIDDDVSFYFSDISSSNTYLGIRKYVHQLQNLYFALTGEELTIS